jgi:IclR family transcriptional regulator, pca regulon regulatory protein
MTPVTPRDRTAKVSTDDRDFVGSFEKGLSVIQAFDDTRPRLTLSEVAKLTGMTRAAARRYLLTLTRLDYANFDGRFFNLTPKVLRLGYAYLSSSSLPDRLQPVLERLSRLTGESSSAAILDGDDIVYVARSGARRIMSIGLGVGSRLPAYCTSMGRAILAYQSKELIEAYLDRVCLAAKTPYTITDKAKLRSELVRVRERGYSAVNEELELGLRSIAVPVMQQNDQVSVALNVSTQAARVSASEMEEQFLAPLREAGEALHRTF